ncbi:hypothetical protein, partial [Acinetobacter bouvetii]
KATVDFDDDYIFINGKHVWFHCDSMHFAVGKKCEDDDDQDGGEIEELFPSLEFAIIYCLEPAND